MSIALTRRIIEEAVTAIDSGRSDVAKHRLYAALCVLNKTESELIEGLREVGKQNNFYHISPETPDLYKEQGP